MFEKGRGESSQLIGVGALLLSATFAVPGCERPSNSRSQGAVQQPNSYLPTTPSVSVEKRPHDEMVKEITTTAELQKFSDTFHAMYYFTDLHQRYWTLLSFLVEQDRIGFGAKLPEHSSEDQREASRRDTRRLVVKQLRKLVAEYDLAKPELSEFLVNLSLKEDFLRGTASAISLTLLGEIGPDMWTHSGLPEGELSEGGRMVEGIMESCLAIVSAGEKLSQFKPTADFQPSFSVSFPIDQARTAEARSLISVTSKYLATAPFPENGPSHLLLAPSIIKSPSPGNWRGFMYVLDGANKNSRGDTYRTKLEYPAVEACVLLDDNCLLKIQQKGPLLFFSRNASGYAQASVGIEVLGFGGNRVVPLANLYTTVNPLEALAYVNSDWKRIQDGVVALGRTGRPTLDPNLIAKELAPLVGFDIREFGEFVTENQILIVTKNFGEAHPPVEAIPVYLPLKDSTLMRIEGHGRAIRFSTTASGYAVSGGGITVPEARVSGELPVSNIYTEISVTDALGYFNNDWQPIYEAVLKQARAIPGSVWPPYVLAEINPRASMPEIVTTPFIE